MCSSVAALAFAAAGGLLAPAVKAENFTAANETELRNAIAAAAASTDPSSTITLTAPIAVSSTPFADLNGKSVTIVATGANTLSGVDNTTPGTSVGFGPAAAGSSLTIIGNVRGGDATAAGVPGGHGLTLNGVTLTNAGSITGGDTGVFVQAGANLDTDNAVGLVLTNGRLINNEGATITGGSGIGPGNVGIGAFLDGGTGHVNRGTIQGGLAGATEGPFEPDHSALPGLLMRNTDLTNYGTIRGGFGSGVEGDGVEMFNNSVLTNYGLIKGTNGNGFDSGDGIQVQGSGDVTIVNYGTIEAGWGQAEGIISGPGAGTLTVINHGAIASGAPAAGARGAISINQAVAPQRRLILEMHGGSELVARAADGTETLAKVWVTNTVTNDVLRLAGDQDDELDVSQIAPPAFPQILRFLGFDLFEKVGSNTWTITGQLTRQVAPWDIFEGTLLMSENSDLGNGLVEVWGGTLAGVGIVGPTINYGATTNGPGGTIAPGINGVGTLTVDGTYTGSGGLYAVETVLGDDDSATDLLAINGGTTGNTFVRVTNLGGTGDQTQEGIKIVDFDADNTGAESSDATFSLLGDAVVNGNQVVLGGAYAYSLFQGTPTEADGDWYLRSIGFTPSATAYESYPGVLLGLIDMPTWQQRVGNIYMPNAGSATDGYVNPEPTADVVQPEAPPANFWTRIEAAYGHYEGDSDTGTKYDLDRYRVQAGIDGRLGESEEGILIVGINAQYGHAKADLDSDTGGGDNSSDSYGGGLTLTWVGITGFYADAQAMVHYLESDLSSDVLGDLVDNNEGWGYGLSLELGRKIALDDAVSLTPQAQLYYTSVDFDDFTDEFGTDVSLNEGESLKGRLGVALGYDSYDAGDSRGHVYAIANVTYEFLDAQSVDVAGTDLEFDPEDWGGELGLGGTYEWAGGAYSIHGEALGQTSFEGSYGVKGTAGFSVRF